MSSAKSALIVLPSEQRALLVQAMVGVCETSFFAFTEPATPDVEAKIADEDRWFQATVSFTGPLNGKVSLALPEGLGQELFAAFLGFEDSAASNSAELHDVMGEFANMVCGAWLTSLNGDQTFSLGYPAVRLGGVPDYSCALMVMSVNDRPAVLCAEIQ